MKPPTLGDSALVIFVPEQISLEINKWRRIYDPNYGVISPHITVAFPLVPGNQMPSVHPILIKRLSDFRPFNIVLKDLCFFSRDGYVLWLKPEDNGILLRIRSALEKALPKYFPPSSLSYIPHLTIGLFDSQEKLFKAQESVMLELKPLQFTVEELLYVVLEQDMRWHIHDRFPI